MAEEGDIQAVSSATLNLSGTAITTILSLSQDNEMMMICLTPQSSACPRQGKPQGKHIHARRAASEIERAIRGVMKSRERASTAIIRAGRGIGLDIRGRTGGGENARKRKPQRKMQGFAE